MALSWVLYADGKRHLEAFDRGRGLRFNIDEVTPACWGVLVRRMDDPLAKLRDVLPSLSSAKARAEEVKREEVVHAPPEKKKGTPNGNAA